MFDVVGKRRWFFAFSLLLTIPGLIFILLTPITGGKEGAFRFLNGLSLIGITNNLGDDKSLITHPTTTTHQRLTPEARAELGISEGFVRFSAGLEHRDDLIEDLRQALEKA